MSSRVNPIRLFVTHAWLENDDYVRIFEYLEASGNFYYYRNTSQPQAKQPIDKESQREDLQRQIALSEVLVVLPAVYHVAPGAGSVSDELCQGRGQADRRDGEFRFHGTSAEGDQGSCGRSERVE